MRVGNAFVFNFGQRLPGGYLEDEEWERSVPEAISLDTLWRMQVYRLALYAAHVGWQEAALISREPAAANLAEQLLRAVNLSLWH